MEARRRSCRGRDSSIPNIFNSKKQKQRLSHPNPMDKDSDVVPPNPLKRKEVIVHEVIDLDEYEDSAENKIYDMKKIDARNKGKAMESISNGYSNHQAEDSYSNVFFGPAGLNTISANGIESSKSFAPGSNFSINLGSHSSNSYHEADNYIDLSTNDIINVDDYGILQSQFDKVDIPTGVEALLPGLPDVAQIKSKAVNNIQMQSNLGCPLHGIDYPSNSGIPSQRGPLNLQPIGNTFSWFNQFHKHKKASVSPSHLGVYGPVDSLLLSSEAADKHQDLEYARKLNKISGAGAGAAIETPDSNTHVGKDKYLEVVLAKFRYFKQFDTADDHSDHHYTRRGLSTKQPPKVWAKRIQDEWKILEKDLPDTIFVRVYESRMDILRAVIKGAEGTPYHDGLFFFDVFFPTDYPHTPPHVHYHAGGLRLNPNLYACGKVCLSLLGTWTGSKNEKWIPGTSSMLQVLVSIQGLILNSKPYFNEPGYANSSGTPNGENQSFKYNEDTFLLSLRTMSYTMRKPPKHFEDFVVGHFCERAHDILVACKAYMDGAQVGCLVKGGVQDVDEGDKSCSDAFKKNVAQYLPVLVTGLKKLGAKDCEKFLPPTAKTRSSKPH